MPKILLSQALPGQVLARPVVTASGVVMVQPGTALTDALIERLSGLGIDAVVVAGEGEGQGDARSIEERLSELDARFAGHEQDALMMQIKEIVARQLKRGQTSGHA